MADRLVLHIGHGKTGSTSIQTFLSRNREELERQGIVYPKSFHIPHCHHSILPMVFEPERVPVHTQTRMGYEPANVARAAREDWARISAACRGAREAILSSEALFRGMLPDEQTRLAGLVHDIAGEVRVIGYVRSPASYYLSMCQQRLRTRSELLPPGRVDWPARIRDLRQMFGPEVIIGAFDRAVLKDGDVVADFLAKAGLADRLASNLSRERNPSLSAEAMAVLRLIAPPKRGRTRGTVGRARRLRRVVTFCDNRVAGRSRPRLRPEVEDFILRSNTALLPLRDEFGIHFSDVDYAVAGTRPDAEPPALTRVEDVCFVDADRLRRLERMVRRVAMTPLGWIL